MKVKVYAYIAVNEIEISKKDFKTIEASHLNAIPNRIFDQLEDSLSGNAEVIGIERIETTDGDIIQEY